jgi:hypothetical protein
MSNPELTFSPESDEIADSEAFSGFSLLGLIASLVGILSIQYVHFMPLAILGTLLGMFVLLFSKKLALSKLSRILGFLAVASERPAPLGESLEVFFTAITSWNKLARWRNSI